MHEFGSAISPRTEIGTQTPFFKTPHSSAVFFDETKEGKH
jgi:hypothetical protein